MLNKDVTKIVDQLSYLYADPYHMGKMMAYEDKLIQERFMDMCMGFILELSVQSKSGTYVNDNGNTAIRAREITESLLTYNERIV